MNVQKKAYDRLTNKVIFLTPITPNEYFEVIKRVSKKKSAGIDDIPGTLLKDVAVFIREPLTDIANASFSQGCFPKILKHALIIPMLKKGDRTDIGNYRQISLLSVFSKFLETAFCTRIVSFLENNNLLNPYQHGFTKKRSTTTAVTNFICEVHEALDTNTNAVGIFYDYSKAFDTICHNILLEKLEAMGISGNANNWIKSYLEDRIQTVALRGPNGTTFSEPTTTNVGLPQGSTISPILFTLFTADLSTFANAGSLTLYADDTTQLITCTRTS
jgi:Reverse transcriptase (RNA-dependent DNA polymerase)